MVARLIRAMLSRWRGTANLENANDSSELSLTSDYSAVKHEIYFHQ